MSFAGADRLWRLRKLQKERAKYQFFFNDINSDVNRRTDCVIF